MAAAGDCDASLALLSSRFEDDMVTFDDLKRALKRARGDVDAAFESLRPSKRRRTHRLDSWLASTPSQAATSTPKKAQKKDRVQVTATSDIPSINTVLKPPKETVKTQDQVQIAPLLLGTPELVHKHCPCTLQYDALPRDLATRLYLELLQEAQTWQRNKWYMVEREVESPHTTAFYYDPKMSHFGEAGAFWYNGRESAVKVMTPAMMEARDIVEDQINALLRQRDRFPLEWAGKWQANVAAANCYDGGKESVGAHSDRLNYLGPAPTIASISLGVGRIFRLRGSASPDLPKRTFDIPLPHNSLCVMHAGCQEGFKHAVIPQKSIDLFRLRDVPQAGQHFGTIGSDGYCRFTQRINITFRFYRPDFCPTENLPYPPLPVCKCGQPCILRPDMKNKQEGSDGRYRYFFQCQAGAATEGKSCGHYEPLDMKGRGPCIKDA